MKKTMKMSLITFLAVAGLNTTILAKDNVDLLQKIKASKMFEDISKQNLDMRMLNSKKINKTDTLIKVEIFSKDPKYSTLSQKVTMAVLDDGTHILPTGPMVLSKDSKKIESFLDIKKLNRENAGVIVGTGPKEVFVFTDPSCPFCRKLSDIVEAKHLEKKYTFIVYYFPLEQIHKGTTEKTLYIMNGKTNEERLKRMKAIKIGDVSPKQIRDEMKLDLTKVKAKLNLEKDLATDLGVSGTPTIITVKDETPQIHKDWPKFFGIKLH